MHYTTKKIDPLPPQAVVEVVETSVGDVKITVTSTDQRTSQIIATLTDHGVLILAPMATTAAARLGLQIDSRGCIVVA